jgi:hypothetical protein
MGGQQNATAGGGAHACRPVLEGRSRGWANGRIQWYIGIEYTGKGWDLFVRVEVAGANERQGFTRPMPGKQNSNSAKRDSSNCKENVGVR